MLDFINKIQEANNILGQTAKTDEDTSILHSAMQFIANYDTDKLNKQEFVDICYGLIQRDNLFGTIYILSILINVAKESAYTNELITYITNQKVSIELRVFILRQMGYIGFHYPGAGYDMKVGNALLSSIVSDLSNELGNELLTPIPYADRNHDFIVVLTSQLLSLNHGPSKHAIDHCYALIHGLGKKVLLINTAEMSGRTDVNIPFYKKVTFNYLSELINIDHIAYKDIEIPFFQCDTFMPNVQEVELLVKTIRNLRPEFILEIGCGSVLAGVLDRSIPVLSNGTMHSLIECSATRYQTLARELTAEDLKVLKECNINPDNIIYSMFTSEVKPKTQTITRADLGLPLDAFAIASVGNRLGNEITDELMKIMSRTIGSNAKIYYIFFGRFETFEERLSKVNESIRSHFVFYGSTSDTMSCLENCNMYLNPPRIGGGMSSIEALAAGLPAITLLSGDGGIVLGKDFSVETLSAYENEIVKCSLDEQYYASQANKAIERGQYLQDSNRVFCDTVKEFMKKIIDPE